MEHSRYIGRVGALALALGIGMIAPAIASADPQPNTGTAATGGAAGKPDAESSGSGSPGRLSSNRDGTAGEDAPPTPTKPSTQHLQRDLVAGPQAGSAVGAGNTPDKPAGQRVRKKPAERSETVETRASVTDASAATPPVSSRRESNQVQTPADVSTAAPSTSTTVTPVAAPLAEAPAVTPERASVPVAVLGTLGVLPVSPDSPVGGGPMVSLLLGAFRRPESEEDALQMSTLKSATPTAEVIDTAAARQTDSAPLATTMASMAAPAPSGAAVDYKVTDDWGSGFVANTTLTANQSNLDGWTVEFDTPAQITDIWNATIVGHTANHYVVQNESWNGQVAAGQSTSFGFQATPGSAAAPVTNFVVNGVPVGQPVPPAPPSIAVADATLAEGNSASSNLGFTVTLSKAATTPITVNYATTNGTATAGSDYTAKTGTLTFAPGETSKTITVPVTGDTTIEPNETINLTLSNPSGATIADGSAIGTITNDDIAPTPPSIAVADATIAEGNSASSNLGFTVTLSKAATTPITVNYATTNGTATAGSDYTAKTGTLTFAPGETSKTITVPVTGDTTIEPNETINLTLSSPSGATIADGSAIGTITNDDIATPPVGTAAQWGEAFFAPYVDMAGYPPPNLVQMSQTTGATLFTLGFMQVDPNGKPAWGGYSVLEPGSTDEQAVAINKSIADLKASGGDVMISFGGAAGTSLSQYYSAHGMSAQQLADAYGGVIDTYGVTHIDFDVEGAAVADPAANTLNAQALALLQKSHPDVQIWYTLPVLPTGLTADGLNVVESALKAGVKVDGVNVMAMDYGESAAPTSGPNAQTMGTYAIQSAQSTYNQLSPLYARYGQSFGWNQLGVTPMLGVNDATTEVFTTADAQALTDFARSKGIGMLSMWSLERDNPGTLGQASHNASGTSSPAGAFSGIFNKYGVQNVVTPGASNPGGSSGGSGTPVQGGATTTVNWQWGTNTVLNFNPATDKLDFVWMRPSEFDVSEQSGSTVITILNNNQTYTLQGVKLNQLQAGNIVALDSGTAGKWQVLINAAKAV